MVAISLETGDAKASGEVTGDGGATRQDERLTVRIWTGRQQQQQRWKQ